MIYNANLDKSLSQRTSIAELRAELKRWEELQRVNAKKRDRDIEVGEDLIGYQVCTRLDLPWYFSIFSFAKLMASDIVMPY